ncbi:MAG: MBL fold metallo-hydrolase [Candidatus Eremiobacteraeota bacterium]|nr:MBL fold metallo-hydrolase [Candidatus Eremiobacteraeota bacterium]
MIRTREANILFDFGSGSFAKLREVIDYPQIDAIVITHMHADHFLDLIPLRYGLKYGPLVRDGRMALWLPPGGERLLRALTAALITEGAGDFLDPVFDVREYDPRGEIYVGNTAISFVKTVHYIDAYAMRAERDGSSIVYSSDTAPSKDVERLARGCSLLLCESTLGLGFELGPKRGHLSAIEAGALAHNAGAQRLLLTHYGTEFAPEELVDAARTVYHGPAAAADDGTEVTV